MIVCPEMISAEKYSFKVKAKKISGSEGFMAMFGYKDPGNYQWFNVGGWSDTQNNVEQAIDGYRVPLCKDRRYSVESDRWYDIQVDVEGDSVRCYIDGNLDLSCRTQKGSALEGVYASTTIDDEAGMMFVKVVNVGEGYADGVINLSNCEIDAGKEDALRLIRLSAEKGSCENTISDPRHVYPEEGSVGTVKPNEVHFKVPAYSVNIIKIRIK